ncbi:hypothetical protein MIMGU_mgv1a006056mg [Erythranthe guttata]|uniref:Uncharacterized protein n=1 Tax=Erythranthe guttata TaxID=4155 RepID=A0A022QXI0_ERYGU|nr:hypothetical protein MIMGU_mgv1a006056mg [Erythranthe guttata]
MAARGMKPFQLLEINIISGQDLQPVLKKMRTYARAWVNPGRKLSSVDDDFLGEDTSAVMIEIYAAHWFRDVIVGTVRVLVGNLIPPPLMTRRNGGGPIGMRFVALQVRRPSGRPQGILNIGVALLDGSMRSMPLYRQLSASAVGYRDLMQDPQSFQHLQQKANQNNENNNNNNNNNGNNNVKPILRRSRSERSERVTFDNYSPCSSIVAVPKGKDGSVISISESADPFILMKKKGKASSVISGAELRDKKPKHKKGGKPSSVVSDSVYSKGSSSFFKIGQKETTKISDESNGVPTNKPPIPTIGKPIAKGPTKYGGGGGHHPQYKASSIWSDSEVGPSPSEVAAAMMAERRYPLDDNQSSVLDGWSMDESVEGLRSKLERWRMELPPLYDNGFSSSSYKSSGRQVRRRNEGSGGSGLFSCFGNICGYECQCVCGKPPGRKNYSSRYNSSSVGTPGRSFL